MTVPANSITRVTMQYRVPNVDCLTSFHLRNDVILTNDAWRADMLVAGPVMMNQLRRIQAPQVQYLGAVCRVLDQPQIPSVAFSAGAVGQANTDPLPAVNYMQLDIYSSTAHGSGRRVRNAMRISGVAFGFWQGNALEDELEQNWLDSLRGMAGSTWYAGNAAYFWVTAYRVLPTLPTHTWGFISAINSRFSARVLSSRQR